MICKEKSNMKILVIIVVALSLSGCAKVKYMDQLLTLKGLADEQTQMKQYVEEQDQKFSVLVQKVKTNSMNEYINKRDVLRVFDEPVYKRSIVKENQVLEKWLYRYSTRFFDSEKVYLYFDSSDQFVKSEYVEAANGKVE